jgi:transcriptional regulator with GAF, ATPase, and Fis domain
MLASVERSLRAVVRAKSVLDVCAAMATTLARARSVALVRVWTQDPDGVLTLMASAGTPTGGGSYNRLDGEFREMAVAAATIAAIAGGRQPFVVHGIRGDEEWLTNPGWAARQGLRAFLAFPLVEDDRVVGIFAVFDREVATADLVAQLQLLADIAASRIAELQVFDARPPAHDATAALESAPTDPAIAESLTVVTRAELRRREKQNIEAALAKTRGKVFGKRGAAALLGMRPTTLASRIKALKIR